MKERGCEDGFFVGEKSLPCIVSGMGCPLAAIIVGAISMFRTKSSLTVLRLLLLSLGSQTKRGTLIDSW
jgi:hypothetical protein